MINQSTIDSLKAMKLTAMATELEHQLEDASTYETLGFEERLGLLVDAEWNRRQAVYCKIKLPKVAKQKWTLLQVQIGQSCKGCI